MLTIDPNKQFEELKARLLAEISSTFPIVDSKSGIEVRVKKLEVGGAELGTDDIKGQMEARLSGRSYTAPVYGHVEIVDRDGKVLASRRMRLAEIPRLTRHHSFIIGGQEKTVSNQWRLRPGAYVKATEKKGEYEAQFQLAKGKSFDVQMEPGTGYMFIKSGSRKIPLYSVLKATGVSDDEMKKAWGDKSFAANQKKARYEHDLKSFYTAMKDSQQVPEDLPQAINKYLSETKMDAAVTKTTLGGPFESVSGPALLRASAKLINVSANKVQPDPIDSLEFKELWTPTDHFVERLKASKTDIHSRVLKSLGKKSTMEGLRAGNSTVLRDIVMPDLIQKPINHVFATALASNSKQTNPVTMLADHSHTTIMGPGGLKSEHQVTLSNTSVDPSHLGFLDPVFTPEGSGAGTSLHLTSGVSIKDRKPYTKLYNLKTGKVEELTPAEAARAVVVLPDQIQWQAGKPKPINQQVRVSNKNGEIEEVPFSKAEYALITPGQVFSTETNLVPFMQNDAAGRTTMSARHMAQALSVVGREPPAVQVEAAPGHSFEKRIGETFLSHKSPVDGTVIAVKSDEVIVKGKDGREHAVHLYDHYPLNDKKAMLHSKPLVKVGDSVKAGQVLADHSFTKNGVLALGANVRVAYVANGANHEDGIVLSESAAKKLGTEHLLKPSFYVTSDHTVSKTEFEKHKGMSYTPQQLAKIDANGLIKPGTRVEPGDPLVLALRAQRDPESLDSKMLAQLSKKSGRLGFSNAALTWDHPYPGTVVRVTRANKNIVVHVKTEEPLVVGSKVSTRHSAKGIVTQVVPDHEMPFFHKNGKKEHVEMLINPVSVPGRMNPGQILETAAGKIAEKTGKPYIVKNFDGQTDYLKKVQDELKKHGLKETETLIDPKTGRKIGDVTVGPHYVFQLEHQIDKKTHVRHGGFYVKDLAPMIQYDTNMVPRGGGESGAQSLGSLGVYGALAAGLKKNLGEMQTLKSDKPQAEALWQSLVNGEPLPPPQVPFVYSKFEAMLHAAGLNTEKKGSQLRIMPLTDKEILERAGKHAKVTNPAATVMAKNMKPESGGIFDTRIFGPDKNKWGYVELASPMPNPVFAKAIVNLLDLRGKQEGKQRLNETQLLHKVVSGELTVGGKSGGAAVREALAKIDIDKEMKKLKAKIDDPKVKGADLSRATFTYKALQSLKEQGKTPAEAYTMQYLPVLPPIYRPFQEGTDSLDRIDPLNQLYRRLGMVNNSLLDSRKEGIPHKRLLKHEGDLFQEMQNLIGTTPKNKKALDIDYHGKEIRGRHLPGILHSIAGESPKDGFFQDKVIGKKQDYSARATIVADPTLGPDEIGVPKKIAFELYRPIVARRLTQMGIDPFQAQKDISARTQTAEEVLRQEIEHRPVLMKRDPVLHQYGIIGQKVRLTDSRAIKVSPLVLPPIGGDIDGDAVALMLPISHEAVQEVHKLLPSNRSISASTGEVLFTPTNEALLALYRMSLPKRQTTHSFTSKADAEKAFVENKINLDDVVTIEGKRTTLGRARIASMVPQKYRERILTDLQAPVTKKFVNDLLKDVARNEPAHFGALTQNITQLGFKMAYESGHTVRLSDLEPLRADRQRIISEAKRLAEKAKTDDERTKIWQDATKTLHQVYSQNHHKNPTNVSDMAHSGIKAKREQFQGLVIAPMLVEDHLGRPSKIPITRSFSEGIDIGGYFLQSSGARRGVIQKTDAVRDPGVLTKELIQSNIDSPITSHDCGTTQGVSLSANDRDLVDRYLASPVMGHPAGSIITPEMQSSFAKNGVTHVFVRSPLKCRMPHGVCSTCMGKHPSGSNYAIGDNVGIISAQAIGERASQLMLKQTHNQGIVPIERGAVDEFSTVQNIFGVAKKSPVDAVLAPKSGKVTRIETPPQGGYRIYYDTSKVPLYSRHKPKPHVTVGYSFHRGEMLTEGDPNLRELTKIKGIEAAQDFMVDRVGKIYEKEGVLRRHVELTVRNATSTMTVVDPGDHPSILRGDHLQKSVIDEINRTVLKGKRPIIAHARLEPMQTTTAMKQKDWMGRLMSNQLQQHITNAASIGEKSDIHGLHPIPGLAYGAEFGHGRGVAGY